MERPITGVKQNIMGVRRTNINSILASQGKMSSGIGIFVEN